jgi:hypothetical protein
LQNAEKKSKIRTKRNRAGAISLVNGYIHRTNDEKNRLPVKGFQAINMSQIATVQLEMLKKLKNTDICIMQRFSQFAKN